MDDGEVLSKAWRIIWKFKVLWIFGILAGCSAGSGTPSNSVQYQFNNGDMPYRFQQFYNNIPDWQIALGIALIVGLFLILFILAIVLSTVGRIGIVRGTLEADAGATRLTFGELFNGSFPYFWRVFGLNLLFGLLIFLAVFLLVGFGILAAIVTLGIGLICLIPLICLLAPLGWFVSVIIEQANAALVVDDLGVFDAVRRGWQVVRDNLGETILMGLILIIGGGIVGFLFALPFGIFAIPLIASLATGTSSSLAWGAGISILCVVLYLPVLLVLSGILRAYIGSSWTLTYLRLTGRTPVPPAAEMPQVEPAV